MQNETNTVITSTDIAASSDSSGNCNFCISFSLIKKKMMEFLLGSVPSKHVPLRLEYKL